ncbi:TPA: hypothetical protein ACPYUD_003656 [Morganella morganii]
MKTVKIDWLEECPKYEHDVAVVQTEKGREDWLYDGDKVTCENCGQVGIIEADGECGWVVWDETINQIQ